MTTVPLTSILDDAIAGGYGVMALNVFDDLTLRTAVQVAERARSPLIVQTSVKTVRTAGAAYLSGMFARASDASQMPVTLHLDHCPHREVVTECIAHGWNSVLFDASHLPLAEARSQTTEVVAEAHASGVQVEGEIEGIQGVEDGIGSDDAPLLYSDDVVVDFIKSTGVDCFAPAIGNAHGMYKAAPKLDVDRVQRLFDATRVPMALHGGSGLTAKQFEELICAGCAKVNISTALKRAFIGGYRTFLDQNESVSEPLAVLAHVRGQVADCVGSHIELFGSAGSVK